MTNMLTTLLPFRYLGYKCVCDKQAGKKWSIHDQCPRSPPQTMCRGWQVIKQRPFFRPQLSSHQSATCTTLGALDGSRGAAHSRNLCECALMCVHVPAKICLCEREGKQEWSSVQKEYQRRKVSKFYSTGAPAYGVLQTLEGKLSILNLVRATVCLCNPWHNNRLMWSNSISLFPGY